MFPSDMRKRRGWFLPLVGGAEINRIQNKAPPTMYFTSRPYPVEVSEAVTVQDGGLRWQPEFGLQETVTTVSTLVSGVLRSLRSDLFMPPVEVTVDTALVSGTLRTLLRAMTVKPEEVSVSTALVSGTLKKVLIQYTNAKPENIRVDSTIVSGTLK